MSLLKLWTLLSALFSILIVVASNCDAAQANLKVLEQQNLLTRLTISDRNIAIYLPPNYEQDQQRYATLYMNDGQAIFSPLLKNSDNPDNTMQLEHTLNELINSKKIEPLIVIGIHSSPNRSIEFSPSSQSENYMDFITNDLKRYIDKQYRTLPEPKSASIGGFSLGGLISFMTAWTYPKDFSKVIMLSPVVGTASGEYISTLENQSSTTKSLRLYIDNGDSGFDNRLQAPIDSFLQFLSTHKSTLQIDYVWRKEANSGHNIEDWKIRLEKALIELYGKPND
jgi:enterochelin esterase-like enzyme